LAVPEHLRALVFILVVATGVFLFAKRPFTAQVCAAPDFERRRNLWFTLTLAAFLAHNIWLFVAIAVCALYVAARAEPNRFALYLSVMLVLPRLIGSIPGFGLVNEFFAVEPLRLLSLMILLPAYLSLRKQAGVRPFGSLLTDNLLLAWLALEVILTLPYRSFTAVIRESVFYAFTDTFLIYYVASRSLRTKQQFDDALGAFIVGAMVFSGVLFLEFLRGWLLYNAVDDALGVGLQGQFYLMRSGRLRAEATAGQAIPAGLTCAVALGLFLYVRSLIPGRLARTLCLGVLLAGSLGAFSRAPWVGAAMIVVLFMLLGPKPLKSIAHLALGALAGMPILLGTDAGQTIIDHLPWIGTVDARSVEGRDVLFDVAIQVVWQYPWFGRFDFYEVDSIQALRGGDGMIDIVNTYLLIALKGGVTSLALFAGAVGTALWRAIRAMLMVRDKHDDRYTLGSSLVVTILGVLLVIGTCSPISFIYPLLWSLVGMAIAYARLIEDASSVARTVRHQTAKAWA
jgi:hypothetical protein